jgi:hypothetical protein
VGPSQIALREVAQVSSDQSDVVLLKDTQSEAAPPSGSERQFEYVDAVPLDHAHVPSLAESV